ncbi:RNA-binding domain-containing protein [Schizopora paradoxa]|uniref:RNA-binding domain-containing protein n=1 Tax=Schizopora paradoxa TaxID=27342 RepID=A0A0H2SFL7_9AGAM|nr:RNA-binding domain-containing protein [Schizopora paradoxa]
MSRGRSTSPRPLDRDVDMTNENSPENPNAKVVIVTNLTRNVFEAHLQTIFGFYGEIVKVDLPLYATSGQNRGKAALEYVDAASAHKAASHMNGGQLDGAVVHVEVSDLPIQPSRPRSRKRPPPRNGRPRSPSLSASPPRRRGGYEARDSYRDRPPRPYGRRGPPERDTYRPLSRSRTRSRSRSRSPYRRGGRLPPRRRSPSYARGGTGYRGRSRSRSFSVTSSRSRARSYSRSRSRSRSRTRSRSRSYASYSSRSRSKSASRSRGRRSASRDDIRDSRSRSRSPHADM